MFLSRVARFSRLIEKQKLKNPTCLLRLYQESHVPTVIKSRFEDLRIPNQTITDFLWSGHSESDDLTAVTCAISERTYNYGLVKILIDQGAKALIEVVKLQPGETVALLMPNIPEFLLATHASLAAGLVVTFANPLYTEEELLRQFMNAKVKCIITIPLFLESSLKVAKKLQNYSITINVGGTHEPEKNVLGMQELLTGDYKVELPKMKCTDVAVLPYTSGTTGLPKGAMLTHSNLIATLLQSHHPAFSESIAKTPEQQQVVLGILPMFHILGLNGIMNLIMSLRGHLITIPRFTPEDYIASLEKFKPNVLFVVPSLIAFLIANPNITKEHLAPVKRIISGGAPAPKTMINKLRMKIDRNDCTLEQGYGMTETSPLICMTPKAVPESKNGSCGLLVPGTEARLLDIETGKDKNIPNVPGELVVKGPQVMQGYLNDPTATSKMIDENGWLYTGDVAYYDEDHYFYIIDRTKELIKVKGLQVSPTELENIIQEISSVLDVAVVGIPDEMAGELPKAFIVKKPNANINADEIMNYVNPRVATYKKLDGGIIFVDNIPRNPSGKIMRDKLKMM